MCPRQIYLNFLNAFNTEFGGAHQRTSTGPGIQTVLRNRQHRGFSHVQDLAEQYLFFETVIAGNWQSCQTVLYL